MAVAAQIYTAKVMHKRLFPRVNQFIYRVAYLALPLKQLSSISALPINHSGLISFYEKDHGAKSVQSLQEWIDGILLEYGLLQFVNEVVLVSMPRILGYVFNPVSFWMCLDHEGHLRAVLAEVNNTFGESHSYLCAHEDKRPMTADDWLQGEKVFHVSPFLPRDGEYRFRFAYRPSEQLGIWIDYVNAEGKTQLLTSLVGSFRPLTKRSLWCTQITHPLVTIKTILLIHWQAIKLISKGIRYIPKPIQLLLRLTTTRKLTKS